MRPMFGGEGCAVNEAGISAAGNPMSRMFDAATSDQFHAQQMRDGYMGGMRPPMGGMMRPDMMAPMSKPMGGLEGAWSQAGAMRPMGPRGPMMGDHMANQFMNHMRPQGPMMQEQGFFTDGPMSMSSSDNWAQEFGAGPRGPAGGLLGRPPMPMQGMRPPMQADWANEFAMAGPRPHMAPNMQMDAAFKQAEMEAAFARPPMPRNDMEAAFMQARAPMPDMEAAFAQAQNAQMEEAFAEAQKEVQDKADMTQAAQMVEMLRNSGNPKFANSQFVDFIDKVSKGDLQFKENSVIDRQGNEVDWDTLYDTAAATATDSEKASLEAMWGQASGDPAMEQMWKASGSGDQSMEQMWQGSKPSEAASMEAAWAGGPDMQEMWKAAADGNPQTLEELEALWKDSFPQGMEGMEDMWKMAGEEGELGGMEQAWLNGDGVPNMDQIWSGASKNAEYKMQDDNPYLDSDDPLAEAQRLIREGRDREALLALEAEVQKNPESSEGWRFLGQLYAELDQDVEAIQCLRRGHEVDPYNLDSLLALGVSCTNELDQLPALRYLRKWIENHEDLSALAEGLEPPADYEYEAWRQQVTQLFNRASEVSPMNADVFVALGVMENINRNYEAAIRALAAACRLRPNDHTCWNKLGATLANSGKSEQAVIAYHQGLSLKPNYARSWSNLAIAHANLGQHSDAARFYLSSLVLNPDATHIWNFLHSAVLNMGGVNAFEAIDKRDLAACTKLIEGVLDPSQLPKPSPELQTPPDEILASIGF